MPTRFPHRLPTSRRYADRMKIPAFPQAMSALALLELLPPPAGAQSPPRGAEEIGSWLLSCPHDPATDRVGCRLRHRVWVLAPQAGRPDAALEVESRDGEPVPVLAVHGVTLPAAAGAVFARHSTAEVRFDF